MIQAIETGRRTQTALGRGERAYLAELLMAPIGRGRWARGDADLDTASRTVATLLHSSYRGEPYVELSADGLSLLLDVPCDAFAMLTVKAQRAPEAALELTLIEGISDSLLEAWSCGRADRESLEEPAASVSSP